jgi:UDPglucose 6-dehydrogenase
MSAWSPVPASRNSASTSPVWIQTRAALPRLEKGEVPFFEPGITELVSKGIKEDRLHFTTDVAKAVDKALVIFIAVGTPPKSDGSADLSYVEEVGRGIAKNMTGYKVIVTKSTVPVGTGEKLREVIKANQTGRFRFDIVSNPEFLREGSAIEDFMRPNRVVIGADSEQAVAIMKDLYRPLYLLETPIVVTDIPTAEMIKYASNAFLAVKISFINEIATVCEKVGADVQMVSKGMGLDNRIGNKFLHAGPGFGGSCFPKDSGGTGADRRARGLPVSDCRRGGQSELRAAPAHGRRR